MFLSTGGAWLYESASPSTEQQKKPGALTPRALFHPHKLCIAGLMPHQYPTSPHLRCGMTIPDTPEQLFEELGESTLRELFPAFDALPPAAQKMVRLLHTELTKGALSDVVFHQLITVTLETWRTFNRSAMQANDHRLLTEMDVDEDWILEADSLHRMDQYLVSLQAVLSTLPPEGAALTADSNRYQLRPPSP